MVLKGHAVPFHSKIGYKKYHCNGYYNLMLLNVHKINKHFTY